MSVLKQLSVPVFAAGLLVGATLASSSSAEARHYHRGTWVGSWMGKGYASGTTIPAPRSYYGRAYRYWNPEYAPAGPFVDYPYPNCANGVCWY
jgi:hypothetical protein